MVGLGLASIQPAALGLSKRGAVETAGCRAPSIQPYSDNFKILLAPFKTTKKTTVPITRSGMRESRAYTKPPAVLSVASGLRERGMSQ